MNLHRLYISATLCFYFFICIPAFTQNTSTPSEDISREQFLTVLDSLTELAVQDGILTHPVERGNHVTAWYLNGSGERRKFKGSKEGYDRFRMVQLGLMGYETLKGLGYFIHEGQDYTGIYKYKCE